MLGRPIIGRLEAIEGAVVLHQEVLQLANWKIVAKLTQQIGQMYGLNWNIKKNIVNFTNFLMSTSFTTYYQKARNQNLVVLPDRIKKVVAKLTQQIGQMYGLNWNNKNRYSKNNDIIGMHIFHFHEIKAEFSAILKRARNCFC